MTGPWRGLTGVLVTVSRGSLMLLLVVGLSAPGPLPSGTLLRVVVLLCFIPELAAWIVRRVHAATFAIAADALVVRSRFGRIEIPLASIAAVVPWAVPLPAPGLSLRLSSGERLAEGMTPDDPASFVRALGAAGVSDGVFAAAARHPLTVFASAKRQAWRRVDHPLFKFVAFSLVPTLPLFRLRQFLVYGGTFGEYYQYGLKVYVLGFGLFWLLYAVYLVLYAAALRAVTEAVSFAAAFAMPERAGSVRRVAETVHRILYFLGTPAVLALRFYPW